MNLNTLKLVLLSVMICSTLFAGLSPLKVLRYLRHSAARASSSKQHKHVSLILCLLTCFSGGWLHSWLPLVLSSLHGTSGVFLATCFLHLFPELVENVGKLDEVYDFYIDYPVAELLSCLGFFLLFFLEEHPSVRQIHKVTVFRRHYFHALNSVEVHSTYTTDHVKGVTSDDENVDGHCQKHCPLTVHRVKKSTDHKEPQCTAVSDVYTTLAVAEPERCETNCEKVDEDPPILMKSSPHAHSHGVRSITFVLALSIHSVIEGIAFGVGDNASETTALFLSLLVHKLIVSFSVGLQLARTHAHQLHWVVASVFILALMSPLGAVVGMVVQSAAANSFSKDVAITILQGLAVGTFLYVTFFEVLLHERDNEHPNLLKLLVMLVGFSLIGLLRLIDNHDHSDFSHSLENGSSLAVPRGANYGHHRHHHDHIH
ncbi:unnamed protein product [Angiostrongylus costaricensis]|uniref:Zinc transporter ZIP3 n=1 Tax=Angiostrongylus costaricensis TaxID=334426 RepID=A0A0R3P9E5_ANGCS|nr:unnamed protein product [Angiostrongylus costaricensis]